MLEIFYTSNVQDLVISIQKWNHPLLHSIRLRIFLLLTFSVNILTIVHNDPAGSQSTNNSTEANENSSRRALIDKVINIYLRHNTSLICLEDVMNLYNEDRENCVKLPEKKKSILKLFYENRDLIRVIYMVECDKCKKTTKISSECTKVVKCCGTILKKSETNFFVYLPIEDQISHSVKRNWSYIKNFDTNSSNCDSISDAHDGDVLKKILEEYKESDVNILSLCLNVDGAKKFKSNSVSLWPIQLSQNYLPPEVRFLTHNIIVAGLYYGRVKLSCRNFLLPLVEELDYLKENKIKLNLDGDDYMFKPIITHCAVDLPAKSMLQQIKQFGGYCSCTYCKIRGEQVLIQKNPKKNKKLKAIKAKGNDEIQSNKFVRYVEGNEIHEMRDEAETLKQMFCVSNSNDELDGVKGVSCLVAFEHFNIIKSMIVEYMHCVLLGVQKQIFDLFLNPKNSGMNFYISPKVRLLLNKRILAIKPPSYIVRKPRSLEDKANFKASEYRFHLLYYLPVCLSGLVAHQYIQHVRRLSAAVYILLKSTIPKKEVNDAEKILYRFVKDHQNFFGKQSMVMNIHLLEHLAESVRQLGPLWCHSAFPFERNNGVLLKMANGTTDVLLQISSKYALSKSIVKKIGKTNNSDKILLGKMQISENSLQVLDIETLQLLDWSNKEMSVHNRIRLGKTTYTSLMYTRPKKSIDYFIGLKNENVGMAKFYIEYNERMYVVMEKFEAVDYLDHITKVRSTNQNIMASIDEIDLKYLYMKVGPSQYVCSEPNPYEIE